MATEITAYQHECVRCGFTWRSFTEHPKKCGRCKQIPTAPRKVPFRARTRKASTD